MRVGGVVHFCSTLTKRECQSHALEGPFCVNGSKGGNFGMAMLKKWLLTSLMAVTLVFVSLRIQYILRLLKEIQQNLQLLGNHKRALCYVRKKSKLKMGKQL